MGYPEYLCEKLFCSDAKQVLKAPQINFPLADCRGGEHLLADPIFGNYLEFWARLYDCYQALIIGHVYQPIGEHRRGILLAQIFDP